MRLGSLLVVLSGTLVLCTPIYQPIEGDELQVPRSAIQTGVKVGLIASFSLAGLLGLAVGVTEYASKIYTRLKKIQIENHDLLQESNFNRSRKLAENEFRFAGTDVVLDLVEKYVNRKDKKGGEEDYKPQAQNKTELMAEEETVNKISRTEAEEAPLPRLSGFAPLSERAVRYEWTWKG